MTDWQRDFGGGRTDADDDEPVVLTTGDMADGDHLSLDVSAEPEVVDTNNGDALRVPATFAGSSHDFTTEGGAPVEQGDDVVLVTWSSRLVRALGRVAGVDGLAGVPVRIDKGGSGYDVEYSATVRDDE